MDKSFLACDPKLQDAKLSGGIIFYSSVAGEKDHISWKPKGINTWL